MGIGFATLKSYRRGSRGQSGIQQRTLTKIAQAVGLDPAYFADDSTGEPNYQDYLVDASTNEPHVVYDRPDDPEGIVEGWITGMGLDEDEAEAARTWRFRNGPTIHGLNQALEIHRNVKAGKAVGRKLEPKPVKRGDR